ncbi:ester cyclase [Planctomycetota bacterium]
MHSTIKRILVFSGAAIALSGFLHTAVAVQRVTTLSAVADTEANKDSYRRINQEAWSQGQLAVVDEFVAPDYVYHDPALGDITGPEGLKQTIMMYRTAYPDLQFTIDDVIAEDDLVALRWSAAGTHQGELMGIPATGLETTAVGINIARFVEGKIVEEWSSWDVMGLMQQLGVVAPPRPGPEFYVWDPPSDITGDPGDPVLNKLLVLRVKSQFWNGKDIAGLDETHHSNAIGHDLSFPGPPSYDAYKEACLAYQIAFPDFHVAIDAVFAEADKVVTRWTATGTHQNELTGIPASGKAVKFTGITIYRVASGKVAETWWAYDALGVVQQITSPPEYSPVGTWIVSTPAPDGPIIMLHSIFPQDSTGTRFGGIIWQVNDNPTTWGTFPEGERGSYWATETVRTGPNAYETTMLGYTTKKHEGPLDQIVDFSLCNATWTITGPNSNEGDAVLSMYTATQDADGDGLPDEGQEPAACMEFTYTSKRLTMMPPCVPPPTP